MQTARIPIRSRSLDSSAFTRRPESVLRTPSPGAAVRTARAARTETSTRALFLVVLAMAGMCAGLLNISGHALLTRESYRRAQVRRMLIREHSMALLLTQQQAVMRTPAYVEHRAAALGMVRADERQAVVLPRAEDRESATVVASLPDRAF